MAFTLISLYSFVFDGLVCIVLVVVNVFYIHLWINELNRKIGATLSARSLSGQNLAKIVDKYLTEHNNLCAKIAKFNKYWSQLYLTFILTTFPVSLITLHQILFERLDMIIEILYSLYLLALYSIFFIIQYFMASFSAKMHKMCKPLARIQWRIANTDRSLPFKVKLQTYFERLSHKKKRIGIAIGSLLIITYPLFTGVSHSFRPGLARGCQDQV